MLRHLHPRFNTPKLILISGPEYTWVSNFLKAVKRDTNLKKKILSWEPGKCPDINITRFPDIDKDDHTVGTLCWTVQLTQIIIQHNCKIKKHKMGYSYTIAE
jgi:hypothetical protein